MNRNDWKNNTKTNLTLNILIYISKGGLLNITSIKDHSKSACIGSLAVFNKAISGNQKVNRPINRTTNFNHIILRGILGRRYMGGPKS